MALRRVSLAISSWIGRLGEIWVEGQVASLTRRNGVSTQFLTLRDTEANISMTVTCARAVLDEANVTEGARIVLRARPDFYTERGTLQLRATEIRQVGLGELLARLEQLKRLLGAEGLFASERKKRLPFLPGRVGLITGRASAAERDVVENARRRLPSAQFRIENVATQGTSAVTEIIGALERLDADASIDVIVIARGGGSIEDLLPFSNEALVRAVAACRTPVVSAIGHETDSPLLDLVADVAASTPTDAAKRVVPDLVEQSRQLVDLARRARRSIESRVDRERELMSDLPARLRASVRRRLDGEAADVATLSSRARRRAVGLVEAASGDLAHVRARILTLSPQATLDRGYAVVQRADGTVVRSPSDIEAGQALLVRVADGRFAATVDQGHGTLGP
ncbi:MAG: exodeoxyribonuclease large subunit [Pseudonocardiales bacterium]|nr:exodeoxyribonuclease large subunit [Pseudonocardiales bacterium]